MHSSVQGDKMPADSSQDPSNIYPSFSKHIIFYLYLMNENFGAIRTSNQNILVQNNYFLPYIPIGHLITCLATPETINFGPLRCWLVKMGFLIGFNC